MIDLQLWRFNLPQSRPMKQAGWLILCSLKRSPHQSAEEVKMIVITGASGRTGKRAAEVLLDKGEKVRAIGRDANRLAPLAKLGAEPFVGRIEDVPQLTAAFEGAEAVYLVLPEDVSQQDMRAHQDRISDCYAAALAKARVPFVVNLSSMGAQHSSGTGPIVGLHNQEQKLNAIGGLNVLHMRAGYFMDNLLMSIGSLRGTGTLPGGIPGDVQIPWIATRDIGAYAAERLASRDFKDSSVQELHGQRDVSMNEAAALVGKAIGRTDVRYEQIPGPVLGTALAQMGLPAKTAELIVEMWNGASAGLMQPQEQRSARNTTPTSLETFVAEVFAPAFLASQPA
jgi:uncharacterized protein YbjT (DUF2867 family)